jgi:dihydroorotase-like cyclic amidohydrolase
VFVETCPQYSSWTSRITARGGVKFILSPPLGKKQQRAAVGDIKRGLIDTIATDTALRICAQSKAGGMILLNAPRPAGVELRYPMFSEACLEKDIRGACARLCATNPRSVRFVPQKGAIGWAAMRLSLIMIRAASIRLPMPTDENVDYTRTRERSSCAVDTVLSRGEVKCGATK